MAFADSTPLPDRYLSYCRDGVARIDSDFEANESDVEDFIKLPRVRNISNSYYNGSMIVGIF